VPKVKVKVKVKVTVKLKVNMRTLVMPPLTETHIRSAEVWHALSRGCLGFTCTPTCLFANGMNHAFPFPAEAGPHFTDPGGMEG